MHRLLMEKTMKEQHNTNMLKTKLVTAVCCALIVTGCASKKPNSNLDAARSTFDRVSANEVVNKYSTEDLNAAKIKLDIAIDAWEEKKSKSEINKRAYIAEQYALIAEQRSTVLQHQAQIENGKLERTNAQMELRVSEANNAKQQAQALQREVALREQKLQAQLAELNELKALQAQNTDRGMVLTLGDVLFDTNESTLRTGAIQNLDKVVAFLQKYPDRTLQIEGHTDDTGEDEYNFNLSTERALAVRTSLQSQGIAGSRIVAKGLGENAPVASNGAAEGRQRNRRVELIFDRAGQNQLAEIDE